MRTPAEAEGRPGLFIRREDIFPFHMRHATKAEGAMPTLRQLGRVVVWLWIWCIGLLSSAWAGTAELVIPPNSGFVFSSAPTMSATDTVNTPTFFYAFQRYPGKTWYSLTPWNGQEMQGVAIFDDYGITVWWIVYGVWDNDGIEDWEVRLTKPDGTFEGLHWHTEMKMVNDVYQKCFVSSNPVTGAVRGQFCSDDPTYGKTQINTLIFGYTHTFWSDKKIEVWNANLTHNGAEIWATPWLLGDLRLLNPNSGISYNSLIDSSGQVTSDLQRISTSSAPTPSHVAADGVTPLLFRVGSTPEVPVTLKVTSGLTDDGMLTDFYGGQTGPVSISPVMQLASNNNYYGVGLYTAPPEFSTMASSEFSRTVQLEAEFVVPWQSYPAVFPVSFELLRPPLVMIHGMWSNPDETWNVLRANPAVCGASRICVAVNWSPADTPLPNNVKHVSYTTRSLLAGFRQANVAITQADVIAHSAGGPLFRLYRQSSVGNRPDNFFLGDFRKILTIGSPHHGTPVADFVQKLLSSADPVVVKAVQRLFASIGKNTTSGIIQDLRLASPTMLSIAPTVGLAHAWIGELPSLPSGTDEKKLWVVLSGVCSSLSSAQELSTCSGIGVLDFDTLRERVFNGQVNDGLVGRNMQAGGVSISAQTVLSNTAHTRETQTVSPTEVAALLDGTGGTLDNGGFQ